jgi:hypothetical protein
MNLLRLSKPSNWIPQFQSAAPAMFRESVLNQVRKLRSSEICEYSTEWLDDIVEDCVIDRSSQEYALEGVRRNWTHCRAFHGTRLITPTVLLEQGLRTQGRDEAIARLRAIFNSPLFSEITEQRIQAEVDDEFGPTKEAAQVWFSGSLNYLRERCGQYLLYGSERLIAAARGIKTTHRYDYAQAMKLLGTPTVAVCNVPVRDICEPFLRSIVSTLVCMAVAVAAGKKQKFPNNGSVSHHL